MKSTLSKSHINGPKASILSYITGFYIFSFYMELALRFPILQSIRYHFTFGLFLCGACLLKFMDDKKTSSNNLLRSKSVNIAYLLIALLGLYTVFSYARDISFVIYTDRVVKFALLSFLITVSVDNIKDLKVIMFFMLLAWFKLGSEGLIGWYTGGLVWQNQGIMRLHGAAPYLEHPNSFSGFALGCLPFCILLLKKNESLLQKIIFSTMIVFSLIIILYTGSRTGYMALLFISLYVFFKMDRNKCKIGILSGILMLALAPSIPDQYVERFNSSFTGKEAEGDSSGTRTIIIKDAFGVFANYPLGVGVQAFPTVRMDMYGRFQDTHNLYLEILTNTGLVGLIVFFLFIKRLLALIKLNRYKATTSTDLSNADKSYLDNLSHAIALFIIIRLFLGLFGMDLYEPYWWIALGYALAINNIVDKGTITNSNIVARKM
ncbi:O-antigen ligase family protein [Colwellia sp. BRX8-4]|uniref:O-antigen ligase family protein n=1 Tax=Colwellia sp. BRX8-4 TaxID=2759836 RepID=UPI0015F4A1CC|nr:O-antigen ligase family protein [Colwellia sp. BRX8-4]MBA6372141.1 O-antigen ligase family protein [Colwellia sp. BRX8-4]